MQAATDFRNGKLVFISPEGNRPPDATWSSAGIGRLIYTIGLVGKGDVVFAEVKGGSILELAKFVNPLSKPKPFQHLIVHFSKPIPLDSIIEKAKNNKNLITIQLQEDYKNWQHSSST